MLYKVLMNSINTLASISFKTSSASAVAPSIANPNFSTPSVGSNNYANMANTTEPSSWTMPPTSFSSGQCYVMNGSVSNWTSGLTYPSGTTYCCIVQQQTVCTQSLTQSLTFTGSGTYTFGIMYVKEHLDIIKLVEFNKFLLL